MSSAGLIPQELRSVIDAASVRPASQAVQMGAVKNFHKYIGGDPSARASWEALRGKEFLTELSNHDPAFADRVRGVAEGRSPYPASSGMGGKPNSDAVMLKNAVHMYDPEFDFTDANARNKMHVAATSGDVGNNIGQLNQLLGHLHEYKDNIDAPADHGIYHANVLQNWFYKNILGNSETAKGIHREEVDQTGIASEAAALLKGKGSSNQTEVDKWQEMFDPNLPKEQRKAAVAELVRLARARLIEQQHRYDAVMGKSGAPLKILNPSAADAYSHLKNLDGFLASPDNGVKGASSVKADPLGIRGVN